MSFPAYPGYKDSGMVWLGSIPEHWLLYRSKNVFSERNIKALESDDQLTASQKYGVIPQKLFSELEDQKVMQVILGRDILKKAEVNDFVISMRSFQGGLEFSSYSGAVSSAYVPLYANRQLDNRFFKHLFKSVSFISALQNTSNLVRDGQALRYNNFVQLSLPFPSINEQRTIGAFLDNETTRIDALIEEQQRLIKLLKEKRQAVISHAVTKGLDPTVPMKDSGVEWLGEVPAHWVVSRVKNIASFITSGPRGWSDYIDEAGEDIFLQSGDMDNRLNVLLNKAKRIRTPEGAEGVRTRLQDGDVVVCITGANTGRVGVLETVGQAAYVNQHLGLIRPYLLACRSRYLGYVLSSSACQTYFNVEQYGLKEGLSLTDIAEAPLMVPPLAEQVKLIEALENQLGNLDGLTADSEMTVELLQERRSALISAAVTGKIDVRGWNPPTSALSPELEQEAV